MPGQLPPRQHVIDPHEWHLLVEGPIRVHAYWYGACRCGQPFKGISREAIYIKSQTHINRHEGGGGDAA